MRMRLHGAGALGCFHSAWHCSGASLISRCSSFDVASAWLDLFQWH